MTKDEFFKMCDNLPFDEYGCQIWPLARYTNGYPQVWINRPYTGTKRGHRIILEQKLGRKIKLRFQACHSCDTPACVNPNHIYEGTQKDNIQESVAKGRWNPIRGEQHYSKTRPELMARGERHGSKTHPERFKGPNKEYY